AGDLGFFAGTALSILVVSAIGDASAEPSYADHAAVIAGFGAAHGATTVLLALLAFRGVSSRR
ncbi:MAG: hypothetical protein ACKORL_00825, partial [Phycisphaerales bacterium]